MALFLFIASITFCLASIIVFIAPKIVRPKEANPSRVRVALPFLGLAFAAFVGSLVTLQPEQAAVASPPSEKPAAPSAEIAAPPNETARGIGVALAPLEKYFTSQGYVFEPVQGEGDKQSLVGQNKTTHSVVMLMGSANDIRIVSLIYIMEKDNVGKAAEAVVSMADVLKTVFPKWEKPGDWLLDAIRKEGATTKQGGAVILYKPSPTLSGVTLTIGGE